jgi:hypothetical protein
MLNRCPGRENLRELDSVIVPCPSCGRPVEFFTDEPKRHCRCGRVLLREALPQCAAWCAAGAECLGQVVDMRELESRLAELKNDPQAQQCLKTIRERLQKKAAEQEGP